MAKQSILDILGGVTRFGRYTVIGEAPPYHWRHRKYRMALCRCDCGTEKSVAPSKLRDGVVVSCGCHAQDMAKVSHTTHGLTRSPEYRSWAAMKSRCFNPKATGYADYGGRGITVCERWCDSFEAFLADIGPRPCGMTLDRYPDVNGNYEPGNCRWATAVEQGDNTRAARRLKLPDGEINLSEAARRAGLSNSTIRDRLRRGMTPQDAINTPRDVGQGARNKSNNRYVEYGGRRMLMIELSELTGVEGSHINYHLQRGRTVDEAVAFILAGRNRA